jgi:hypothetical protein
MGGTYGTTLLNGIKIKMFDDGTTFHGLGVIAGNLYLNATDAATVITLNTNNTERMRITSSGNVGIGVTPSAWGSNSFALQTQGGALWSFSSAYLDLWQNSYFNGTNSIYQTTAEASYYRQNAGLHLWYTAPLGTAGNTITFTERMRITSGGNVCIGTTSAISSSALTTVQATASALTGYFRSTASSSPFGIIIEYTGTSPNNTSNEFINCGDSSAARFKVTSNGNCYNVSGTYTSGVSDIKYKEQVVDANSQWDDIKNLRVVNFKFIKDVAENGDNALKHIGFIAQEVEKTSPHLIEEMSDEKTGETWKTIKASIIHTKAIKALQEAMARIEELENRLIKLESK